jgi:hypothetical protein
MVMRKKYKFSKQGSVSSWVLLAWLIGATCPLASAQGERNYYGALHEPVSGVLHVGGQFGPDNWFEYSSALENDVQPRVYHSFVSIARTVESLQDWTNNLHISFAEMAPDVGLLLSIPFQSEEPEVDGKYRDQLTAEGYYNPQIDLIIDALKELDRPIFVRPGYEFNGSHNNYDPHYFKVVFTNVTTKLRDAGVDAAMVWNPLEPDEEEIMAFYPGDEWVDWWGINLFFTSQINRSGLHDFFLPEAHNRGKPVIIPEATPRGYDFKVGNTAWNEWFVPFFALIHDNPGVKAFAYTNYDWENDPLDRWPGWGDTRLEVNSTISDLYIQELGNDLYVHSESAVFFHASQIPEDYNDGVPKVLDTDSGYNPAGYSGQTIYWGYKKDTGYAAISRNSGLKVQWAASVGQPGDASTAVFVVAKEEFRAGKNTGTVYMAEGSDTLNALLLCNGLAAGALQSGSFRWVVQDRGSFYISEAHPVPAGTSEIPVSANGLDLSWFNYDPSTVAGVSTIGSPASPPLSDIGFVGVQLEAVRGVNDGTISPYLSVKSFGAELAVAEPLVPEVVRVYRALSQASHPGGENRAWQFALDTAAPLGTFANDGVYQEIYGAHRRLSGGDATTAWGEANADPGAGCRIRLNAWDAGVAAQSLHLFKTDGISFDAQNDKMAVRLLLGDGQRAGVARLRFVIEEDGQFYISNPVWNYGGGLEGKVFGRIDHNALSMTWYDYDPSTVVGVSTIGSVAQPTFTGMGFIGFHLHIAGIGEGGDGGVNFGVREFTVSNKSFLNAYARWADQFGGTNVIGSADSDHDGDGLSNLGEFALDGDPTDPDDRGRIDFSNDGDSFAFVHAKLDGYGELAYTLLDKEGLVHGPWSTNGYASRAEGPVVDGYLTVTNIYDMTPDKAVHQAGGRVAIDAHCRGGLNGHGMEWNVVDRHAGFHEGHLCPFDKQAYWPRVDGEIQ